MEQATKGTLELVIQGGAVGLLALLLGGMIYVAVKLVPAVKAFFERLTASLGTLETRAAVIETKLDAAAAASALSATASTTAAMASTSSVTSAVARVSDAVASESFEVKQALGDTERRLTAVIRREQASDPPPPSRASAHTPASGMPVTSRRLTG